MRVLVTTTPGTGHVFPVLPLAVALRESGHQLLWAIAADGVSEVRRHGFEAAVAGMNLEDRRATLASELPAIFALPPRSRRGHLFAGFFARAAASKSVDDLGPIFDRFRPDVVIHEIGELGAAPHAVSRGIPHVTVPFGGGLPDYALPLVQRDLVPVWASLDLPPPSMSDMAGDAYLHPFPKSMGQRPALPQLAELRPTDVVHPVVEVPDWLGSFGQTRPAVYVTAGTTPIVATLAPWKPTFEALGRLDVDVLVTIGPKFPIEELGPLPPNVRVERFVPQGLILDRVAVVVSHAGAGTMLAAARQGVPQLLLPTWADQWENSDALARAGSGILLEEDERSAVAIHNAVDSLMNDATYRTAAEALASEIAAMPAPADHVTTIERLVSAQQM